jgi:hypothetical protein
MLHNGMVIVLCSIDSVRNATNVTENVSVICIGGSL